jgi:hypothetical protein
MAKSAEDMTATMAANLKEKTGKSLDEWVRIARGGQLDKHGKIVAFLKSDHGLTHGYANLVAATALQATGGGPPAEGDALVAAQYGGAKAALRPVYDKLIVAVGKFGTDVEIAPKKTYVSLRRSKQFALLQPSTATRIDVGINLKGDAPTKRLEASGSFNAMVSHRVRVGDADEVDKELVGWLKAAYDRA